LEQIKPKFKTLHEAIQHVLRNHVLASYQEIADIIQKEQLWFRKSDQQSPGAFQIRLRTTVSRKYKHLFITLANSKIALAD